MQKLEELARELRDMKDGMNEYLHDTLGDYKQREAAREKRDFRQSITIWLLILALVGSFVYYQWSFKNFIEQYDFTTESYVVDSSDGGNANYIGRDGDIANGISNGNTQDDAPEGQ